MADFFQNGEIVTLHRLSDRSLEKIEKNLRRNARIRKVALILPSLYSELETPALPRIIEELKNVDYIKHIVITMVKMDKEKFNRAKKFFSVLPQEHAIIWNDGPRMMRIYKHLKNLGIDRGQIGKGSQTWMAIGYILAKAEANVIALHDCDIKNYSRELLARLVYPMMHPSHPFEFCKGYYARAGEKLNGRVTRIFVTPLIRTLKVLLGDSDFLNFLDSFRYILAGEFSLSVDLAQRIRIPSNWGLEMGVLAEVQRNAVLHRIAQVDIAKVYDHKHQKMVPDHLDKGLLKMACDIALSLFKTLTSQGVVFSNEFFITLKSAYSRTARDFISRYAMDASLNGLKYDRHEETQLAEAFVKSIIFAGQELLENPFESSLIPNWGRVIDAEPNILSMLLESVEKDNKGK